jgi:23S rRNA pseudouridine1911/1915/1917 synthase
MTKLEFQITAEDHKKRLDDFLFGKLHKISKKYLRDLIKTEKCEVNGELKNRGYILKTNDFVEIELEISERKIIEPEPIPLEIVFEDAEILVVDKPAGMLVHPTFGIRCGTLLNALAFYLNAKNDYKNFLRAGLVHRLDRETSGLMIIAKNARSHRILSGHFKRKLIEKRYFAFVEGVVKANEGEINAPVGRFEQERAWNVKPDGKPAVTRFWTKKRFSGATLLELEPVTGRTNQLRIHLAHVGHPIIGDEKYGGSENSRLCLHAFRLAFHHPNGGARLEFESKAVDFAELAAKAG